MMRVQRIYRSDTQGRTRAHTHKKRARERALSLKTHSKYPPLACANEGLKRVQRRVISELLF